MNMMHKHSDELLGTILGLGAGIFHSIDKTQIEAMITSAECATVGFIVTIIWKAIVKGLKILWKKYVSK